MNEAVEALDSMAGVALPEHVEASTTVDEVASAGDVTTAADGDAATTEPAPATEVPAESPDVPMHRAVCQHKKCEVWVLYRPTASGAGFMVLERGGVDVDASFGIGEHGVPTCPHGHGEMTIADEAIPASDAIAQVAAKVSKPERRLPLGSPDFNDAGALQHVFELRHQVKAQEAKVEKSRDRYKKDKEELDELNVKLGELIDDYEKRKEEREYEAERKRAGILDPTDARLVKCRFEQLNPGVACPICSDTSRERRTAPGSEEHGVEAKDLLEARELVQCIERLKVVPHVGLTVEDLRKLPLDQRSELECWAADAARHPEERDRWMEGGLPRALGTPHVAGPVDTGKTPPEQACRECGVVVFTILEADEQPIAEGTLVYTNCPGKAEPARRVRRHKDGAGTPKAKTSRRKA